MEKPDKEIVEVKSFEQLRVSLEKAGKVVALSGERINGIVNRIAIDIEKQQEQALRDALGITEDENTSDAMKALQNLWDSLKEPFQKLAELCEQLEEINELGPPPTEIKRRLKYAKNPMEIKQLNRQLAAAYKKYKGKNKNAGGKERG